MFLRSLSIILLGLATVGCGEKNDPNPPSTTESHSKVAAEDSVGAMTPAADQETAKEVESRVEEPKAIYYVISDA